MQGLGIPRQVWDCTNFPLLDHAYGRLWFWEVTLEKQAWPRSQRTLNVIGLDIALKAMVSHGRDKVGK